MSPAASYLAVTKFYVAAMGMNARIQGVPPFALTYFREEIVDLVARVRDAARWEAYIDRHRKTHFR